MIYGTRSNPPASDTTQQTSRYPEAELYVVPELSISMVTIAGIADPGDPDRHRAWLAGRQTWQATR